MQTKEKLRRNMTASYESGAGCVPKELREKLKKAKAAKGLLQDLEEEIRKFVKSWDEKDKQLKIEGLHDIDSDDDEIVFVGRGGQMHDMPSPTTNKAHNHVTEVERDKLVFGSLANDQGAGFGYISLVIPPTILTVYIRRWLVHSIATYYGLRTWSVTVGDPARREAYVGISHMSTGNKTPSINAGGLPRPLWGMI